MPNTGGGGSGGIRGYVQTHKINAREWGKINLSTRAWLVLEHHWDFSSPQALQFAWVEERLEPQSSGSGEGGDLSPAPRKFCVSGEAEMIFLKESRFYWLWERSGMLGLHCLNSPSLAEDQMQKL